MVGSTWRFINCHVMAKCNQRFISCHGVVRSSLPTVYDEFMARYMMVYGTVYDEYLVRYMMGIWYSL